MLDEIVANDFRLQVGSDHIDGIGEYTALVNMWREGFPDLQYSMENIAIQGENVAIHWTARGTHQGTFAGIDPTKKEIDFWGIDFLLIRNGRIIRQWRATDREDMLAELTGRKCYSFNPMIRHAA